MDHAAGSRRIDLVLTEEQDLLQHTAREFVAGRSSLKRIRALRDGKDPDGFSRDLWREMARLGWVGIVLPEEHGGLGLGYMDLIVVMEQLGRGLMPEPIVSTVLLGANAILLGGGEAQKREHLPAVAAGERLLALAWQEPRGRYDVRHVETAATRAGAGWMLRGEKTQVLDGHVADRLIVSARSAGEARDAAGIGLFLVRPDAPGVTVTRQSRLDARNVALVRLDGVRVEADAALGAVDGGGPLLSRTIDRATVGLAAEMLGSMTAAFEATTEYLKSRTQFGVPIGSFQALKHRAARMYVEIELARSAVMNAARAVDEGRDDAAVARAASIAKARCSDAFVLIGNEGVQMHGGIGMTDEHDIGFFLKRARAAEMTFGDAAWHSDRLAALDGY
jgi:alkylation response protein AidB-like acyl-CoA dehydrogenase